MSVRILQGEISVDSLGRRFTSRRKSKPCGGDQTDGCRFRRTGRVLRHRAACRRRDSRNARSVWTIPTHGFKGAHFATFPPELARRCDQLGRSAVLIDLDERNVPMARDRITADAPLFAEVVSA